MELASLAIAVDSREVRTAREWLDHLTGAGTRAERSLGRVGAGGKTAASGSRESAAASREAARSMDSQASSAQRLTAMIRSYATAVVGAFGAREIIQAADAWQGLENRLRLVTRSHTELQVAMNDVYGIAQRTSQQIDSVGQVYQRFAMNAGVLGITQKQVAELAETTAKAIAVSGSEAAAAEGALMQFGQALAAGVLRGEEFNSVMEGAPALAQALAQGLGVPVGALRTLAAEGKISGDKIVEALTRARDSVDEQFETRIKTVSQAMTELGNSVTRYIGQLSGATSASNSLADGITSISRAIDRAIEDMDSLHRELDAWRTFGDLVSGAWDTVDDFGKKIQEFFGLAEGGARSLGEGIATSFEESFLNAAKELDALYDAVMGAVASLGAGFRTLGENVVAALKWAFEWGKYYAQNIVFEFEQALVAIGWSDGDTMRLPELPERAPYFKSVREEADKAREAIEGTLGATAALQARLDAKGNWRRFEDAFDVPLIDEFGTSLARIPPNLDKTGKALSAAAKAAQQFEQQRRAYLRSQYQEISNLSDQADALEDQVRYYGLSESALNDLTIARLREQQAAFDGITGAEEEIAIRERMIEQYQRIGLAMQGLEQKEAEKRAWESWSRDVEQIFQQVGQSLTDAIFEGGKSGRELVKDLFKTLTLRVLINPVMNSIQGAVTNSLGGMFGLQNPQQGGMMGTVSNLGSAYNAASGGLTGNISNVANWVGEKAGSTALQSFASGLSATFGFSAPVAATGGVASLAGVTAGPGLAASLGSGASGVIGGSAAGIGSAIGAALPWVGGALAIGSLLGGDLFGGGPPATRHGQRTTIDYMGGRFGVSEIDDRQAAGSEQAALAAAQAAVAQANEMFARLGVDAAIESFYAVMESSVLGDRQGVASGGMLRTGDDVRQIGIRQSSDMTFAGFGGWSSAEMLPRLATDIQLSILEAFQQVGADGGLPDALYDMIEGVFIRGLDESAAQQLAQRFSALTEGALAFMQAADVMPHLQAVSFDAAAGLVQLAGGVENLMAAEQSYYQNFYSEAERHGHAVEQLTKALAGAGVQMPELVGSADEMLASYRALVDAQDVNTEAGRQARWALIQASSAFAEVANYAGQADAAMGSVASNMQSMTSMLTGAVEHAYQEVVRLGQQQIAELQKTFGASDSALNAYRSAVQQLESTWGGVIATMDRSMRDLRGQVEATAQLQYNEARAVISTAILTGQVPETADLSDAIRVAQQGVTSGRYANAFEERRAMLTLANEMEALKGIAQPELDTARATLEELERQHGRLRGIEDLSGKSLTALEAQVRAALAAEESARYEISIIEQQLEVARQDYEAALGLNTLLSDLPSALRSLAEAMANLKLGGGAAFNAQSYAAANPDLVSYYMQNEAGSGTSLEAWLRQHYDQYGQFEGRTGAPSGAGRSREADYLASNPDVMDAYRQYGSGKSVEDFAREHYEQYGKNEGRSFDVGTAFVPQDMTANIHRGEIIIDPRSSDILRRYGIGVQGGGSDRETVQLLRDQLAEARQQTRHFYEILKNVKRTANNTEDTANAVGAHSPSEGAVVVY